MSETAADPLADFAPQAVAYARNLLASGALLTVAPEPLREHPLLVALLPPATAGESFTARLARAVRPDQAEAAPADCATERNLAALAEVLDLDPLAVDLIRFAAAVELLWPLRTLSYAIHCRGFAAGVRVVAAALARPVAEVHRALAPGARLARAGYVRAGSDGADLDDFIRLDARLLDLLAGPALAPAQILARFLPVAPPATLGVDDFPALAAELTLAGGILAAALERRSHGVNLLIYGPTGTGKTQLARLLARAAGASLHRAGEEDGDSGAPSAFERLGSLQVGQRALAGARAILVFDELEDLFVRDDAGRRGGAARDTHRMSKLWFNQLLEETAVPTIWISNDVSAIDPAFLRRFAFAIEVRSPSPAQRRRVWDRHLADDVALPSADRDALAASFALSPGQIEMAVRVARLLGPAAARETFERLVQPIASLVGGARPAPRTVAGAEYQPALARCATDLVALTDALAAQGPCDGVSLCLYGPPGTGKSEYVRHLAARLGRTLIVRRGSDLLSMWVGGTERNLAEAFREAREEGAVLLLDEVDSFLRDRRHARGGWEVSQTNELLQQLEEHRSLVACTTNLVEELDPACLRRFVFKLRFDYLGAPELLRLFVATWQALAGGPVEVLPAELGSRLARLDGVTPGDFAAIARRLRALAVRPTPARLFAELEDELRLKQARAPGRAGFKAASSAV